MQLQNISFNDKVLDWDRLPQGMINGETDFVTNTFSISISGTNELRCEECFLFPKPVNFRRRESMIRSSWSKTSDPFDNAITLKLNTTNPSKQVRGVGVQYAVDSNKDGFAFTAFLRVTNQSGEQFIFKKKGETIQLMDESAIFLGARSDSSEVIQFAEFAVLPESKPTIEGFYINSLQLLVV